MRLIITLLFFIFTSNASLIKSTSLEQLEENLFLYRKKPALIYECKRQIEKKMIPSSCFNLASLNKDIHPKLINYINEKCMEINLHINQLENISKALKNLHISSKCLHFLIEQEKILKIQALDDPIEKVLNTYLKK